MSRYLAGRLGVSLVTALLASIIIFLVVRAVPGDVVAQMLGQTRDPAAAASLRAFFGLDRPLWAQYAGWLGSVLAGDLGVSWVSGQPVTMLVGQAFLVTLELALLTLAVATLIGVPLGIVAGMYEGRPLDAAVQAFNLLGLATPVFWTGLLLLVAVAAATGWSPPLVYRTPGEALGQNLQMLALPIAALVLLQASAYSQFVRQQVVAALHQDYVRTAYAKGVPPRVILFKHVLRNILIPLVTFMGLVLVQILGGAVVVETLFAVPGVGRLLLGAIETRDYPVLQGALLLVVACALTVNFVVDLLYGVIDPRVRPA
jgi:peptide/nickel transport system permease protein